MAGQKNFEVDQNATFSFILQYKDDNGNAIDLTGASAKMQVRDSKNSTKLAVTLTSPSGGITINGPTGTVSIKMTPTQTNKLFYPKSSYDLMIIDSNSNKTKHEALLSIKRDFI